MRRQRVKKDGVPASERAGAQSGQAEKKTGTRRRKQHAGAGSARGSKSAKHASAGKDAPKKEPAPIENVHHFDGMHLVGSAQEVPDWITQQTGKIPPGWRFVQVADDTGAEKLVCGYDYDGRLQIRYSERHMEEQAAEKFRRVAALHAHEAKITAGIKGIKNADVRDCLLLIKETGLRPGSAESAREGHYGATTLLAEHVVTEESQLHLRFVGKEGVQHDHEIRDSGLRRMLRKRKKQAEQRSDRRLFETSPDTLNRQFKAVAAGIDASVKDLRTMRACDAAQEMLRGAAPAITAAEFARLRDRVGDAVSAILGNGRDMALGSYIDPQLFIAHSPDGYRAWRAAREKAGAAGAK